MTKAKAWYYKRSCHSDYGCCDRGCAGNNFNAPLDLASDASFNSEGSDFEAEEMLQRLRSTGPHPDFVRQCEQHEPFITTAAAGVAVVDEADFASSPSSSPQSHNTSACAGAPLLPATIIHSGARFTIHVSLANIRSVHELVDDVLRASMKEHAVQLRPGELRVETKQQQGGIMGRYRLSLSSSMDELLYSEGLVVTSSIQGGGGWPV